MATLQMFTQRQVGQHYGINLSSVLLRCCRGELRELPMVKTRPYQSTDWSRLCEIHDASRLDELSLTVGKEAFLSLEQTAASEGLFDDKLVVAEVDGIVRGFIAYGDKELTWLYVDPQFYQKGVGRSLVRNAIADSASVIDLEVLEGNTPALKLYLSEGFKVVKRIEGRLEGNADFVAAGLLLRREGPESPRPVSQSLCGNIR